MISSAAKSEGIQQFFVESLSYNNYIYFLDRHYIHSVFVEKEKITSSLSLMTAFEVMFSLYYNFNIAYPKENSLTLEFIQRYIMKIHPDQGTKSKKKTAGKLKIISLINKLNNME